MDLILKTVTVTDKDISDVTWGFIWLVDVTVQLFANEGPAHLPWFVMRRQAVFQNMALYYRAM